MFEALSRYQLFSSSICKSVSGHVHRRFLTVPTPWRCIAALYCCIQRQSCSFLSPCVLCVLPSLWTCPADIGRRPHQGTRTHCLRNLWLERRSVRRKHREGKSCIWYVTRLQITCLSPLARSNGCFLIENYHVRGTVLPLLFSFFYLNPLLPTSRWQRL